jgi:hypothetical protein
MGRKDPKRNSKKAKKKWKDFGENSTGKDKSINPFEIRKQKLKKEVLNSKTRGNVVADVKARGLAEVKVCIVKFKTFN